MWEDRLAQPDDAWLAESGRAFWSHGLEVYHASNASGTDIDNLVKEMSSARGAWLFVGVITRAKGRLRPSERLELTNEDLEFMASHARIIILDAYDGESWLIFERAGS